MGLDISVQTDYAGIRDVEFSYDHFDVHSLSRPFCNLMCRRENLKGDEEPELDQIGRLSGVDIEPLYEMTTYPEEMGLEFHLSRAKTEAEKQEILREAEEAKASLAGNLDRVLATIEGLLSRLAEIDNLPDLLKAEGYTPSDYEPYFGKFLVDTGDGYIGNNFGQDLRNFKRHLSYIKEAGGTTVFFEFG